MFVVAQEALELLVGHQVDGQPDRGVGRGREEAGQVDHPLQRRFGRAAGPDRVGGKVGEMVQRREIGATVVAIPVSEPRRGGGPQRLEERTGEPVACGEVDQFATPVQRLEHLVGGTGGAERGDPHDRSMVAPAQPSIQIGEELVVPEAERLALKAPPQPSLGDRGQRLIGEQ